MERLGGRRGVFLVLTVAFVYSYSIDADFWVCLPSSICDIEALCKQRNPAGIDEIDT